MRALAAIRSHRALRAPSPAHALPPPPPPPLSLPQRFVANNNHLSGPIPDSIGQLKNLVNFDLGANR
jgi:hypothetical protein